MKRTGFIIALLVAAFSITTFATNVVETKVGKSTKFNVLAKKSPEKFHLVYVSEKVSNIKVRILDAEGNLISVDNIKSRKSFSKIYNFKNLDPGKYTIEVENFEGSASQTINYNPYRQSLNMFVTLQEEYKFKVTVAGFDKKHPVIVKIYDEEGRVVSEEKINAERNFTRIYNLSKIKGRSFTFSASSGSESVIKYKDIKD